jgi:hypothetical protein
VSRQAEAAKIAGELIKVAQAVTEAAKDETRSKESANVHEELNKVSPEYFGNLSLKKRLRPIPGNGIAC